MTTMTEIHDADLPCQELAWVQTQAIRDRKESGFKRISNKQTVNGAPLCETSRNQRLTDSHE